MTTCLRSMKLDKSWGTLYNNERTKFIVTGHSLGGALAILFMAVLIIHEEARFLERLEGVYTFGQPGVGDDQFGEYMINESWKRNKVRFIYCNDTVPRLPFDDKVFFYNCFWERRDYTSWYKEEDQCSVSLPLHNKIT